LLVKILSKLGSLSFTLFWAFIWMIGMIWTFWTIGKSYRKFYQFPSTITEKKILQGAVTFPTMYVCPNTAHSLSKLRKKYPMVKPNWLYIFYAGVGRFNLSEEDWQKVNQIDLKKFFEDTRHSFSLIKCRFNHRDCRRNWELVPTLSGVCLAFDPTNWSSTFHPGGRPSLMFNILQNDTEQTVGWDGPMGGFKVSYGAPSKKAIFREDHAVQLSSELQPTIEVQKVQRTFLNEPFTKCVETNASKSDYLGIYDKAMNLYDQQYCLFVLFIEHVCKKCDCYPNYAARIDEFNIPRGCKPCNFYQHAACMSPLVDDWEWTERKHLW